LKCLDSGDARIAVVAKRLGMSARKLQGLLQAEGTSFQELLDDARSTLAREYLRDPDLSIAEVAYMLGYSEPSAFTRAFRRWTGRSPRELRGQ
jgi:AraC-like DNA-binding protein